MNTHSVLQPDLNTGNIFTYIADTDLSGSEILTLTGGLVSLPQTVFVVPTSAPLQADTPTPTVTRPILHTTPVTPQPTPRAPAKRKRRALVNPENPLDPRTRLCQAPGSPRTEKRRCENAMAVRRWRIRKAMKDAKNEMERQTMESLQAEMEEKERHQLLFPL
ncbi:hypothetical protein Q9L58_003153 [Maublancomyces gigas]|uniref:BZIP domain-containing protein n=1 Tax=Discina gigas TaxID=1032678 RepID=A0ABR3GPJ9_9PEZI